MTSLLLFGQNQLTADSLKSVLTSKQHLADTQLHDLLWRIVYNETNPEETLEYSIRLLAVAQQICDGMKIGKE